MRTATRTRHRNRYAGMLLTLALIALVALGMIVVSVALVWWQQERMVFQPPRLAPAAPGDVRRADYSAADGHTLLGYLVEPSALSSASDALPLLIGFHGNADLAVWQIPWAREVARRTGWRVLLAEYRGYGGLTGIPTYETTRADARAALAFALDTLDVDPSRIALFGHSLGSAVAAELASEFAAESAVRASRPGPAALILQSPLTSARDLARVAAMAPVYWMWPLISRVHYDTERRVGTLDAPVWVAHGERDSVIPVWMGKQVFATAHAQGRLLLLPEAGHNDVAAVGGEAYWAWLTEALIGARSAMPESHHHR